MAEPSQVQNLSKLLSALESAGGSRERVSIHDIRDHLGERSFGPFLLAVGLAGATPASGIPFFPTIIGITVLLTAGQLAIGWQQIWLPDMLLRRSLDRERFKKGLRLLGHPAGIIDKIVRPRLAFLTYPPFSRILGLCCCMIAFVKPPLELIPATSAIPAAIVAIFGLALTTHDGIVAIVGLAAFLVVGIGLFQLTTTLLP